LVHSKHTGFAKEDRSFGDLAKETIHTGRLSADGTFVDSEKGGSALQMHAEFNDGSGVTSTQCIGDEVHHHTLRLLKSDESPTDYFKAVMTLWYKL
jgi:hypothetical protein